MKINDRVRMVITDDSWGFYKKGASGIVVEVYEEDRVDVKFDTGDYLNNNGCTTWTVANSSLEVI